MRVHWLGTVSPVVLSTGRQYTSATATPRMTCITSGSPSRPSKRGTRATCRTSGLRSTRVQPNCQSMCGASRRKARTLRSNGKFWGGCLLIPALQNAASCAPPRNCSLPPPTRRLCSTKDRSLSRRVAIAGNSCGHSFAALSTLAKKQLSHFPPTCTHHLTSSKKHQHLFDM